MSSDMFVIGATDPIANHYTLGEAIGQPGQFGHAVRAVHKASGETRAVKVINKTRFRRTADKDFHFTQLRREIEVMSKMDHPNIIRFFECFETEDELFIVMELCTGGELFDRIKAAGNYSEQDAADLCKMMLNGLQYMHTQKIAHCDLKPDNFLFLSEAKDSPVKIIDFGMSKFCLRGKYFKSLCGTPYYVAPEVIRGQYNHHSDMWSMGVVLFVMLFGYPPFYADQEEHGDNTDEHIFKLVLKGFDPVVKDGYDAHFPQDIPASAAAKDLIGKLLTLDVAARPTAAEALEHPFLTGGASDQPIEQKVIQNLLSLNNKMHFKNAVLELMTQTLLHDTEVDEIKKAFEAIDADGDGTITIDEMKAAMQQVGHHGSDTASVEALIAAADVDGDGKLNFKELLHAATHRKILAKEERLLKAFQRMDIDGDGFITQDEMKTALGAGTEDAEILRMMTEADTNGDGQISYAEFLDIWHDAEADTTTTTS